MFHELRYAVRRLCTSPAFSAVSAATIALAIGANTAMFTFVNGLLLRPLPYPEPQRIVRLLERVPGGGVNGISTLNYLDWARQQTVFDYMAAEAAWRATLTGGDQPIVIRGARVSAHYFDVFGVKASMGRTFRDGDDHPGNDRVVLLTDRLWRTRFGSNPAIVGKQLLLNGEAHTVVGILPTGPFDRAIAQIWKPLAFEPANMTRDYRWLGASARLKPGVTLDQARAEMALAADRLARAYPDSDRGWGIAVDRLSDVLIGPQMRTAIVILFAATVFVLLIACANLANLALARSLSRTGEIAVRSALGASRLRLVQQLLIEHMALALAGGVAGLAVGYAMLKWLTTLIPPATLPPAVDIRVDVPVLLLTLAAAAATGILFGLAPALQAMRPDLLSGLKENRHGTTARAAGGRLRGGLIMAEVALAFVLLVASGLLMRSVFKLLHVDRGFDATNVLTAALPLTRDQHPDPVELNAYLTSIESAIRALPGVRETAFTSALPLEGWGYGVPYSIADRGAPESATGRPAFFKIVSPSYFHALGIRVVAGRALNDEDTAGAPRVAVVNEAFVKREFPNESPVGHRILAREVVSGRSEFSAPRAWDIVGVVAGEKINGLGDEMSAGMYVSNQQSPTYDVNLIIKTAVSPASLEKSVRSAITRVDGNQALGDVRTLEQVVADSMRGDRVVTTILAVFSAIALLLAAVGIYGVISFTAAQRTHEMGLRAALGATAGHLRALLVWGGMRLTLAGLAIGLAAMLPMTDVLSSILYGVTTYDALTVVVVFVVLSGVAALACFFPAWRATRTDPVESLRYH
jgi:putative ABC transport system permease protein